MINYYDPSVNGPMPHNYPVPPSEMFPDWRDYSSVRSGYDACQPKNPKPMPYYPPPGNYINPKVPAYNPNNNHRRLGYESVQGPRYMPVDQTTTTSWPTNPSIYDTNNHQFIPQNPQEHVQWNNNLEKNTMSTFETFKENQDKKTQKIPNVDGLFKNTIANLKHYDLYCDDSSQVSVSDLKQVCPQILNEKQQDLSLTTITNIATPTNQTVSKIDIYDPKPLFPTATSNYISNNNFYKPLDYTKDANLSSTADAFNRLSAFSQKFKILASSISNRLLDFLRPIDTTPSLTKASSSGLSTYYSNLNLLSLEEKLQKQICDLNAKQALKNELGTISAGPILASGPLTDYFSTLTRPLLGPILGMGPKSETSSVFDLQKVEPNSYHVIFINGVFNDKKMAADHGNTISEMIDDKNVHVVHNASQGFVLDTVGAIKTFFGFRTTPNYELNQKVSELHEKYPNDEIVLIAHSQGAQIASTELKNLPASITDMVHAITLGGADWINRKACKQASNYTNKNDTVSNMANHLKKGKEEDYNVTYLPSEGGGHPLQTKNYLDVIKYELSKL